MSNLERIRKELSPARGKKVKARAAQMISEVRALGIRQDVVQTDDQRLRILLEARKVHS